MQDIDEIKEYFKKLIKLINYGATFTLGDIVLVKEQRINDIMCCIFAKLPENYRKTMKSTREVKKYKSMTYSNILNKHIKQKFFLDKQLCMFKKSTACNIIKEIINNIEHDIKNVEEHNN